MPDYNGKTYEIVSKAKLKPVKKIIGVIIRELQRSMRQYNITFVPVLVGSAGRHLVTRAVRGNTGFDFDYNFSLQHLPDNIKCQNLKFLFIDELNNVLDNTPYKYSYAENNTHSITIKFIDKNQSRIIHSCDFAIVSDYEEEGDFFQEILIYDKKTNEYFWNKRPYGKNYQDKLSNLLDNGSWQEIREEYLELKNNNNDKEKKSFSLYLEAVNNVYNWYDWN